MNRVCVVHNEYCPDGDCRWCVAPAAEPEVFGLDFRYGFAMHQPAAEPSMFGIADVDRRLGRIVSRTADNLSANVALLHKLQLRGRIESIPGGSETLTEISYADLGWPPGGVTGDGL